MNRLPLTFAAGLAVGIGLCFAGVRPPDTRAMADGPGRGLSVGAADRGQPGGIRGEGKPLGARRELDGPARVASAGEAARHNGAKTGGPDRLLSAIRTVESAGSDVSRPNRKGALGPYQFLRATWDDHAEGVPWSRATDEAAARVVAGRYVTWIDRTLTRWQGRPATVEQVLAAYNGGVGRLRAVGFDVDRMPAESREYVRRVKAAMTVDRPGL